MFNYNPAMEKKTNMLKIAHKITEIYFQMHTIFS
jgi:hypothetical protein